MRPCTKARPVPGGQAGSRGGQGQSSHLPRRATGWGRRWSRSCWAGPDGPRCPLPAPLRPQPGAAPRDPALEAAARLGRGGPERAAGPGSGTGPGGGAGLRGGGGPAVTHTGLLRPCWRGARGLVGAHRPGLGAGRSPRGNRPPPGTRGRCAPGASGGQSVPAPQCTAPRPEISSRWRDVSGEPQSRCLRDDHRRAARHLRQHAGRVALPARGSLPLRGCQQPQEAGVRGHPT
ncbi:hypothetical protein KIL84_016741, partial [Mauremys mutica]